jgi:antitoxin HicB
MAKYSINILWSEEDKGFIATVPEFPSLSAFGETYEVALKEAKTALEGYIEILKEDGEALPAPHTINNYSGQTRIRMPRELHLNLAIESERQNMSLNSYMVYLLSVNYVYSRLERLERENLNYAHYGLMNTTAAGNFLVAQGVAHGMQGRSVAYLKTPEQEQIISLEEHK